MKWKKHYPKHGDKKLITKFLWFPKRIGNETRWLETATIEKTFWEGSRKMLNHWSSRWV